MSTPTILLTNDDGIQSPYLRELAEVLRVEMKARVVCIAPEKERSAMSHTITLHKPVRVRKLDVDTYSVSGTPVDCVYVGVIRLLDSPASLVISGPNNGYNLGTDVYYSGTVGAAREGGLRGLPALAVSVARNHSQVREVAAPLVVEIARGLMEDGVPRVLNLNVPENPTGPLAWTRIGRRLYQDDVHERTDPRGGNYYWIGGGTAGIEERSETDCMAVLGERRPSVTPIALDPTDGVFLDGKTGRIGS